MIRKCRASDFDAILAIINDAARAYAGVIPERHWQDPYMPPQELRRQLEEGVKFSGYTDDEGLVGVMGLQDRCDVQLIRHAYVRTERRGAGIGTRLLRALAVRSPHKPILIGTWASASWAIRFYERNGFRLVEDEREKHRLLSSYWNISEEQMRASVVLAQTGS